MHFVPQKDSKGLKEGSGCLNHSHSKYSEFPVKREANVLTRHVKGVPFVERRNTFSV